MSENNADIMRAIGNLEGTVKTGFKGVHDRQDTTNGRMLVAEKEIMGVKLENEKQESDLRWLKKSYWALVGIGVPSVIAILIKLFTL